ncbi:hypothetical protein BFV98_07460 [Micromonospora sp. WMMB235]|nr:hypothetical protein BFV98_07460 [Micromonospora sp. WMMB235]
MLRFATGQPVGGDDQVVVDTAVETLVGLPPVLVLTLVIVLVAHGGALPLWAVAAAGTARVLARAPRVLRRRLDIARARR